MKRMLPALLMALLVAAPVVGMGAVVHEDAIAPCASVEAFCDDCGEFSTTVCLDERRIIGYETHTTEDGECRIVAYTSRYVELCPACYNLLLADEMWHECYVEHKTCGMEREDFHRVCVHDPQCAWVMDQ